jgi:hypothetical protein
MKAISQTGSRQRVPPVRLPQPPGTTLTCGHEAPLAARSPRPAAPGPSVRRGSLAAKFLLCGSAAPSGIKASRRVAPDAPKAGAPVNAESLGLPVGNENG